VFVGRLSRDSPEFGEELPTDSEMSTVPIRERTGLVAMTTFVRNLLLPILLLGILAPLGYTARGIYNRGDLPTALSTVAATLSALAALLVSVRSQWREDNYRNADRAIENENRLTEEERSKAARRENKKMLTSLYAAEIEIWLKRKDLLDLLKSITRSVQRGELNLPAATNGQTLKAYAATWLAAAAGALKASTLRFYKGNLEQHIYPALGSRLVTSLRRQDCRALVAAARAKGLRVATVRGIVRALSTVLTQAVEDELLAGNPALRMGRYLRAGDEAKRQIQPFTREEASTVLATARVHFPRWHPLLLCALRTGLRQGELIALQWAEIDFAGRFITVNRNYVRGVLTTPKNHQRRRVDMSTQLVETLAALRLRQKAKALKKGTPAPAMVFPRVSIPSAMMPMSVTSSSASREGRASPHPVP